MLIENRWSGYHLVFSTLPDAIRCAAKAKLEATFRRSFTVYHSVNTTNQKFEGRNLLEFPMELVAGTLAFPKKRTCSTLTSKKSICLAVFSPFFWRTATTQPSTETILDGRGFGFPFLYRGESGTPQWTGKMDGRPEPWIVSLEIDLSADTYCAGSSRNIASSFEASVTVPQIWIYGKWRGLTSPAGIS